MSEIAPDLIDPIIGWRVWQVRSTGLWSVVSEQQWPAMEAMVATCRRHQMAALSPLYGQLSEHPAPDRFCACGIYAVPSSAELTYPGDVFGPVALWGTVVKHQHGYRAQFAYPQRLYVVSPDPRWLTEPSLTQYGVPVEHASSVKLGVPAHLRTPTPAVQQALGLNQQHTANQQLAINVGYYGQQQAMIQQQALAQTYNQLFTSTNNLRVPDGYKATLIGWGPQHQPYVRMTKIGKPKKKRWWRR